MPQSKATEKPVIFFDGYCNLCNKAVQWVLRHDTRAVYKLAPLTSTPAREKLPPHLLDNVDSIVLLEAGRVYTKSTAALKILRRIGGGYRWLYAFILVPPLIRDSIYDVVARFRYRWFGKRESCMMPTADVKERFLAKT